MKTLISGLSYEDETNLLYLLSLGLSYAKQLQEMENGSGSYWTQRIEKFENVMTKVNKELFSLRMDNFD